MNSGLKAVWFDVSALVDPSVKGGEVHYGERDTEKGHGKLADNGWRTVVTMLALQGLVNRTGPRLMYDTQFWNWKPADQTWRDYYARRKGIEFETLPDMWTVISRFRDEFDGLVIHDPEIEQSLYVACMLGAQQNLLPVLPDVAKQIQKRWPECPIAFDLRGRWTDEFQPLDWALEELLPNCEPGMAYSVDRLWSGMSIDALDLAVARKAFIYRCSTVESFAEDASRIWRIHDKIGPNCGIYGWGEPEDAYCRMASLNSNYIMCAEAPNLSFHAKVPVDTPDFKQKSTREPSELTLEEDKVYVAFMTTEGDAMKIHTVFQGGAWLDPKRGEAVVNWGFQPRMLDIAPAMAEFYYESMTSSDHFYCGCSGAGYTYPNLMSEPFPFFEESGEYMRRADLHVMDCWIYYSRPVYDAYARLCPDVKAFVLPCGPVGVKTTETGTPIILRDGRLHYFASDKSPQDMAEAIRAAADGLVASPGFLTVFAVPNLSGNTSAQGGFGPSEYAEVMRMLGDDRFKFVTLQEMAWAAAEVARKYPERVNRSMSRDSQKRIGVNIIKD